MSKQTIIGCICFFLLLACNRSNKIFYPADYPVSPPNGFKIKPNFFVDKTEITNISWKEYLAWTERIFGKTSPEMEAALPDTSVWLGIVENGDYLMGNYLRNRQYDNFPVVGISHDQAIAYSKWRSDRVFEMILIEKGLKNPNITIQNRDNFFTIAKYISENSKHISGLVYPQYRLPTIQEMDTISSYFNKALDAYFSDCKTKDCQKCKKMYAYLSSKESIEDNNLIFKCPLRPADLDCIDEKHFPVFNLNTNVSEWCLENQTSYGKGWLNTKQVLTDQKTYSPKKSNAWTGLRNVCEWIVINK